MTTKSPNEPIILNHHTSNGDHHHNDHGANKSVNDDNNNNKNNINVRHRPLRHHVVIPQPQCQSSLPTTFPMPPTPAAPAPTATIATPPDHPPPHPKTRVLLRVKRRRPRPANHHHDDHDEEEEFPTPISSNVTLAAGADASPCDNVPSARGDVAPTVPERIRLSLPVFLDDRSDDGNAPPPPLPGPRHPSRARVRKRRKVSSRSFDRGGGGDAGPAEVGELERRLRSSVTFLREDGNGNHHGTGADDDDDVPRDDRMVPSPSRTSSFGAAAGNDDDERRTPPPPPRDEAFPSPRVTRVESHSISVGRGSFDGNRAVAAAATATAATASTAATATANAQNAPMKPKRSVIFRKITELKKCLDAGIVDDAGRAAGNSNGNEKSNGKEEDSPTAIANDGAVSGASAGANGNHSNNHHDDNCDNKDAEWNSLGEKKSKWLRIVDVTLQNDDDDDYDIDDTDAVVKRDDAVPNNHSHTNHDSSSGRGPRVRRLRPRPAQSGGNPKRRKLGLVVERSRTVLESDFWNWHHQRRGVPPSSIQPSSSPPLLPRDVRRLIDLYFASLHRQAGGTATPHLSFLRIDPRLGYVKDTPLGKRMVDHPFSGMGYCDVHDDDDYDDNLPGRGGTAATIDVAAHPEAGKGKTVLHYAAEWGDLAGVRMALDMGAEGKVVDATGATPKDLAMKGGFGDVVAALEEAEAKSKATVETTNGTDGDDGDDEEYYYEVYCLEEEGDASVLSRAGNEKKNRDKPVSERQRLPQSSPFLTPLGRSGRYGKSANDSIPIGKNPSNSSSLATSTTTTTTTETDVMDSPPDLVRAPPLGLSGDDDDDYCGYSNSCSDEDLYDGSNGCALMELKQGFGYWNEQGELVLEAGDGKRGSTRLPSDEKFARRFFHSLDGDDDNSSVMMMGDEEHDSNNESYDGNDYPDDQTYDDDDDDGKYDQGVYPVSHKNKFSGNVMDGLDSDYDDYLDADDCRRNGELIDSDDDSVENWRMDFRNRFVPSSNLKQSSPSAGEDDIDECFSPFHSLGFDTSHRQHGWEYSHNTWAGSMCGDDDAESYSGDYTGPMLANAEMNGMEEELRVAYDSTYDD